MPVLSPKPLRAWFAIRNTISAELGHLRTGYRTSGALALPSLGSLTGTPPCRIRGAIFEARALTCRIPDVACPNSTLPGLLSPADILKGPPLSGTRAPACRIPDVGRPRSALPWLFARCSSVPDSGCCHIYSSGTAVPDTGRRVPSLYPPRAR
jgi:hypothetical protein